LIIKCETPSTKYSAKCYECGYEIYVTDEKGIGSRYAAVIFFDNGWREDDLGRPICPECLDEIRENA